MEQLNLEEILEIWGVKSDPRILKIYSRLDFSYNFLSKEEFEVSILRVLQVLDSDLSKAGPHRLNDWELGWGENLKKFNGKPLILHTIGQAQKCKLISKIVISTNDKQIINLLKNERKVFIPFIRPKKLSTNQFY